jgi:MFS family permease
MLLGGVGMAAAMPPTTAAAMRSVARDKAGVGSAVLNTSRQVGGALGIAILGAIVAAGITSSLHAGDTPQAAYTSGFHHAVVLGAIVVLIGAVVAWTTLGHVRMHEEPGARESAEAA